MGVTVSLLLAEQAEWVTVPSRFKHYFMTGAAYWVIGKMIIEADSSHLMKESDSDEDEIEL